jgi:hypothetical protein
VAAVLGRDPYRGPLGVWQRIVLGTEPEPSARMRIGQALEAAIARTWAAESGAPIRLNRRTRTRGHLAATADGFIGRRGGLLEVKWSSNTGLWADGLPEHVHLQAVAQSYVYGRQGRRVTVVALVGGGLREWVIEPTPAERRALRTEVELFYERHVAVETIPEPLMPDELAVYLRLLQGRAPADRRPATDAEQAAALAYLELRTQATAAEREAAIAREALLHLMTADPRPRIVGDGWTYADDGRRMTISDLRPTSWEASDESD